MKIPHFFKAPSRLGTPNPPYRQKGVNFGVEDAPDFILDSHFLDNFTNCKVDTFFFPKPEKIDSKNLFSKISSSYFDFKNFINKNLQINEMQVVIGGDDSVTLPSILAVLERIRDINHFGYIRFDSHADMNLYKKSPTKNFHGMYMRPLYGDFDLLKIRNLVDKKIIPDNSIFIGNLDLDSEEKLFFKKLKIRNLNKDKLKNTKYIKQTITEFVGKMHHIHISIDIDAFDKTIAPATGIPAQNGLLVNDVLPILEIVKNKKDLSLDLVEVNPKKEGAKKTISLAQNLIISLI